VLMGYLAEATTTIRIGSGGIMLPNHAPFIVAEQIGTLESIYPRRIDLGLGRAPGTDPLTMRALRRHSTGAEFDREVLELMSYFAPLQEGQKVKAIPGAGLEIPIWILGSSTYSAHLAAALGLPYAFASHFAPGDLLEALAIYRREFKPSPALAEPYVMVGVPAMAADTDEHAEFLATSMYQRSLGIVRGQRAALLPPVESMEGRWSPGEQMALIRAHPELAGRLAVARLTDHSRAEQAGAGLDRVSPEERSRMQALNDRYRETFGFPFIVAVKGLGWSDIIERMEARLPNTREAEIATALEQIGRIARFRLEAFELA